MVAHSQGENVKLCQLQLKWHLRFFRIFLDFFIFFADGRRQLERDADALHRQADCQKQARRGE
jgi:hypothetical protein